MNIKLLAFDTSTEACSAALMLGKQSWQRFALAPRQHAELLLGMIEELLACANCRLGDLHVLAYAQGPGSFMGVRIATAVAQALGFAAKLPVIPVSTLQALAQEAYYRYQAECVLAAWDARMGEVYWGIYQIDTDQCMQPVLQDRLTNFAELNNSLKTASRRPDMLAGNVWEVYRQQLAETLEYIAKVDAKLYPTAEAVARLAVMAYCKGQTIPAIAAEPLYLRNEVAHVPMRKG